MKRRTIVFICVVFFVGLSILLYPTISNYVNRFHQERAISEYDQIVSRLSAKDYSAIWEKANAYNARLLQKENRFRLSQEEEKEYNSILNINEDKIMGYIEIKKLGIKISIAHGMSDAVLEESIGHMEGSSMPCGQQDSHAVLVGHRGLPSAKLFTDLDQMREGDIFTLHILDKIFTYQVCQIKIVEPDHMDDLEIVKGKDYVTLVTCTPYAVNTHRLLVRGERIETIGEESGAEDNDAMGDKKSFRLLENAPIIAASVLLLIFVIVIVKFIKMRE